MQASSNGGMDVYVIKLDSIGNRIFSTYIGGSSTDDAYGVCTDPQKNIYLTGQTSSNDFYHTVHYTFSCHFSHRLNSKFHLGVLN